MAQGHFRRGPTSGAVISIVALVAGVPAPHLRRLIRTCKRKVRALEFDEADSCGREDRLQLGVDLELFDDVAHVPFDGVGGDA